MKTINKIMGFLLSITLLTVSIGCSKDEESNTSTIYGTWKIGTSTSDVNANGVSSKTVVNENGTLKLNENNTFELNSLGGSLTITIPSLNYLNTENIPPSSNNGTFVYNKDANTLTLTDQNSTSTASIIELNSNSLKLKIMYNSNGSTGETISNFYK